MKVSFHINYYTEWGQNLYILGSIPELGAWEPTMAKNMQYVADGNWYLELELPNLSQQIEYRYIVRSGSRTIRKEWKRNHVINLEEGNLLYTLVDYWQDVPIDLSYYSSAFTKSVFAHSNEVPPIQSTGSKLIFQLYAPQVQWEQYISITGNQDCLGNWNPENAMRLYPDQFPLWKVELDTEQITFPLEYKFLLCGCEQPDTVRWETGENYQLTFLPFYGNSITRVSGLFFRDSQAPWRGAGSVIPVFSLRSKKSFGVGDLGDLKLMVDWIKKTNQRVIQILPVNDTTMTFTWQDSYPYSAISIFALHPIYININALGQLHDPHRMKYYQKKQQKLNKQSALDYEEAIRHKTDYIREYFFQEQSQILTDPDFREFVKENKAWLTPYAAFCYYRNKYQTADFKHWEEDAVYNKSKAYQLCNENSEAWSDIAFTYYQQYILHIQFKGVSDYARKNGIILKGDLPIGINRSSVEAWTEPAYFNIKVQAGAPPDDFSLTGQNWGFPTYNWNLMEQDGFSWWKKRFRKLDDYFDCFRIDHILGFFRIWEIPMEYVQGLCGHFNPALPYSRQEIEQYGLPFNAVRFMTPHIHRDFLLEIFGGLADEVINSYLAQSSSNHFVLKDFCNTQKKIEELFQGKTDDFNYLIKKGLMAVANEVLFLSDPYQPEKYHPRISARYSYLYRELSPSDRYAYDKLYQDFFYRRHNEFWKQQALKRLTPLLQVTNMLVCGEDLGMIPETVPAVMNELHILSLEIERMPKAADREFTDLSHLPYLSVCTTSTHDMAPIRNWWKEDTDKTQRYYTIVLQKQGKTPEECTADIARQILSNHLASPSMLTIIPIQDWFAMDDSIKNPDIEGERINVPDNPHHYWRYQMHVTLEELLQADEFNEKVKGLIKESGRK